MLRLLWCLALGFWMSLQCFAERIRIPWNNASDNWSLMQLQSDGSYAAVNLYGVDFWDNGYFGHFLITEQLVNPYFSDLFLLDLTTGEWAILDGTAPPTSPAILNSGNTGIVGFTIPSDRAGSSFFLKVGERYFPVNNLGLLSGNQDNGSGPVGTMTGYFNARCYLGEAMGTGNIGYLYDLSNLEACDIGSTMNANAWFHIYYPPTGEVSVQVPDLSSNYTLHTSGGYLQSLSPVEYNGEFLVGGQIAVGETYWVSRDIDGVTMAPAFFSFPSQISGDARAYINPYAPRTFTTLQFTIGSDIAWHSFIIEHSDGYEANLSSSSMPGSIVVWDDDGQQQSYTLENFTAEVDTSLSWSLIDTMTGVNYGNSTYITSDASFHSEAPNFASGYIPESRGAHFIKVVQPGEQWNVTSNGNFQEFYYDYYGTPLEYGYERRYAAISVPYNPQKTFELYDLTVGDSIASGADWKKWFLPRQGITFKVNASRWFNQLVIVQPNSQIPITQKGNLQGSYSYVAGQLTFSSSGFYMPLTTAHPDAPWWVWDATRQEVLIPDGATGAGPGNFLNDYDATDTDGDHLPDWWEKTKGTNPLTGDSDLDGLNDYDEYVDGRDPKKKDNFGAVKLTVGGFVLP